MPLHEYRCRACSAVIEVIQKFSDKPLRKCQACGGRLEKLIAAPGFVLKGSGWYASDYKSTPAPASSAEASGEGSAKESPKEGSTSKERASSKEEAADKKADKTKDRRGAPGKAESKKTAPVSSSED